MRRRVLIWGKPYIIEVEQNSKAVWVAVGEYMGETRETKGSTANDAASQWRLWATSKGG